MAFALDATIDDYEVRGVTTGTSKKGNTFKSIRVESMAGYGCELSCTNEQLFREIDKLQKGDIIQCQVRAVSGQNRSYVSLLTAPVVTGNSYRG